jgi:hypothetical protein
MDCDALLGDADVGVSPALDDISALIPTCNALLQVEGAE